MGKADDRDVASQVKERVVGWPLKYKVAAGMVLAFIVIAVVANLAS
jgi:hypothetical protein